MTTKKNEPYAVEDDIDNEKLAEFLGEEGSLSDEQARDMAEKDFAKGFSGDRSSVVVPEQEKPPALADEKQDKQEVDDDTPATVVDDEPKPTDAERLQQRVRSLEGKFGELNSRMQKQVITQTATETKDAGIKTPTPQQVQAAYEDKRKLDDLKEEFPEYYAALEAQSRITMERIKEGMPKFDGFVSREELATMLGKEQQKGREIAKLDRVQPEWETKINTDEFNRWLSLQDDKTIEQFQSDFAVDAIAVLNKYDARQNAATQGTSNPNKTKRLETAIDPTEGRSTTRTTHTAEDDFAAGFQSVRG